MRTQPRPNARSPDRPEELKVAGVAQLATSEQPLKICEYAQISVARRVNAIDDVGTGQIERLPGNAWQR